MPTSSSFTGVVRGLAVLLSCSMGIAPAPAQTVAPAEGAPPVGKDDGDGRIEMSWIDLDGRETKLGDGERIVVISFWATWCEPCVEEWPDLIRLNDKYAPHGVEFIGAAADKPDQTRAVMDYVKRFEIDFRIVLGATPQQMQSVGLRPALPATVVLSERGHPFVRFQHVVNPQRLDAALESMLGIAESE